MFSLQDIQLQNESSARVVSGFLIFRVSETPKPSETSLMFYWCIDWSIHCHMHPQILQYSFSIFPRNSKLSRINTTRKKNINQPKEKHTMYDLPCMQGLIIYILCLQIRHSISGSSENVSRLVLAYPRSARCKETCNIVFVSRYQEASPNQSFTVSVAVCFILGKLCWKLLAKSKSYA